MLLSVHHLVDALRIAIFAELEGLPLATDLVPHFGSHATYFYSGSGTLNRQVMAPHLMAFRDCAKRKSTVPCMSRLMGFAPPNQPDHPWQNFTAFKAKFGGREVHLGAHFRPHFDAVAHDRYMAMENSSEF